MASSPERPDRISTEQPLIQGRPGAPPAPTGDFESLLQNSESASKGLTAPPPGLSPAEIPQTPALQKTPPSIDSLLGQVSMAQDSLGNLNNQLNKKDLRLTNSQKTLLRSKLSNGSTHLRAVSETLGLDTTQAPPQTGQGPMAKFLGYIGDGENQMKQVQVKLQEMQASGKPLNPADLLLMQVKMGQAQQELEYSSLLLSKAVAAITQLLNTQL